MQMWNGGCASVPSLPHPPVQLSWAWPSSPLGMSGPLPRAVTLAQVHNELQGPIRMIKKRTWDECGLCRLPRVRLAVILVWSLLLPPPALKSALADWHKGCSQVKSLAQLADALRTVEGTTRYRATPEWSCIMVDGTGTNALEGSCFVYGGTGRAFRF